MPTGRWLGDSQSGWLRLRDTPGREPLLSERRDLFLTRGETLELYVNLRKIIDNLIDAEDGHGGGNGFDGAAPLGQGEWSWISRDRVFAPMINLARREIVRTGMTISQAQESGELAKIAKEWGFEVYSLPADFIESKADVLDQPLGPMNIRDDLCAYLDDMVDLDSAARGELLTKVVTDGSHSPAQRQAFMRLFPGSLHFAGRSSCGNYGN